MSEKVHYDFYYYLVLLLMWNKHKYFILGVNYNYVLIDERFCSYVYCQKTLTYRCGKINTVWYQTKDWNLMTLKRKSHVWMKLSQNFDLIWISYQSEGKSKENFENLSTKQVDWLDFIRLLSEFLILTCECWQFLWFIDVLKFFWGYTFNFIQEALSSICSYEVWYL